MRPCGNRHGLLMQNRKCYAARRLSAVKIRRLMQAAERALKILNQKTEKDKQAGDGTSGLTREIFDWQTLADFASLGTREPGRKHRNDTGAEKAARSERLTPTEKDIVELFRTSGLINEYIARRGGPTTGAKVGSGVAASLPYMAGFATTSGLGSGAAKTVGRPYQKRSEKPCRAGPA